MVAGDIAGNTQQIIEAASEARDRLHADIIIFPELSITGYPPEDLLLRPDFQQHTKEALQKIRHDCQGTVLIVGYIEEHDNQLFNACGVIQAQQIHMTYYKQELPNYGVFDEKRYFVAGKQSSVFHYNGISISLSICEDIWSDNIIQKIMADKSDILINISASPFYQNRLDERKQHLKAIAQKYQTPILYTNLVGGQDELVFDGGSMVISAKGTIDFCASQFNNELSLVTLDSKIRQWYHHSASAMPVSADKNEQNIYHALVLGLKDYINKNQFQGVILGLSGGIDSALTLCLAVDALGAEKVEVLIMPSCHTAQISIEDAIQQTNNLKVKYHIFPIDSLFEEFKKTLTPFCSNTNPGITEENIQARCRAVLLMAVSNKTGKLVLATGNKSELSVGYSTLYGDMAGGFSPLKDVYKTLVYKLAKWKNTLSPIIPPRVISRAPSAELKPNQTDQDSLPPYKILDSILEAYIDYETKPEAIIAQGHAPELVNMIIDKVKRSEYKRRQAAIGTKITQRAFGRDRRYPITNSYT